MLSRILNKLMDLVLLNSIVKVLVHFKSKYISPRINKLQGNIAASKVQNAGKDLRIHGRVIIEGVNKLRVGDYVRIGEGAYLNCTGELTIGNNVQISRNVLIYTSNHNINSGAIPYDQGYLHKPVSIGNSVWIGMNVTIAPGTKIEDGAIIGMGTVVSGIVPKGAIVVGTKQKIIGSRNIEDFDKMDFEKKYFGLLFPDS